MHRITFIITGNVKGGKDEVLSVASSFQADYLFTSFALLIVLAPLLRASRILAALGLEVMAEDLGGAGFRLLTASATS